VDDPAGEIVRPARGRFSWPLRCTLYAASGGAICAAPAALAGIEVAFVAGTTGALLGFAAAVAALRELHAEAPPHACAVLVHHSGVRYEAGLAWVEAGRLTFAGSSRNWSIPCAAIIEVRTGWLGGFVVRHAGGAPGFSSLVMTGARRLLAQIQAVRRA